MLYCFNTANYYCYYYYVSWRITLSITLVYLVRSLVSPNNSDTYLFPSHSVNPLIFFFSLCLFFSLFPLNFPVVTRFCNLCFLSRALSFHQLCPPGSGSWNGLYMQRSAVFIWINSTRTKQVPCRLVGVSLNKG